MSLSQVKMLDKLVNNTRSLIDDGYYQHNKSVSDLQELPKFSEILGSQFAILGEIKPGSPTKGKMYSDTELDSKITEISEIVDGISVLTEPNYFNGSLENLEKVASETKFSKPILMKDFIIEHQQFQGRSVSAILLIDRILADTQKLNLIDIAHKQSLEVILEVDNETDFVNSLDSEADILAVNNRNLNTMEIKTEKTGILVDQYQPNREVLGFSGYSTIDEIIAARDAGVAGVLLGTVLSHSPNPADFIHNLRGELFNG